MRGAGSLGWKALDSEGDDLFRVVGSKNEWMRN
jgi:hypothetical protein